MAFNAGLVMMFVAISSGNHNYVNYDSPGDGGDDKPASLFFDRKKKVIWIGHGGVGVRFCDASSEYYCFKSPPVSFAVPKKLRPATTTWIVNGESYEIKGVTTLSALGMSVKCHLITSTQNGSSADFFYSEKYGLVAMRFSATQQDRGGFYINEERRGFPY